ncbi:hypothetical protein KSNIM_04580 [Kitasatospora sp. DSM 101779]|nr:hypothetical protein [Kitasatospora sp. DSM 101779]
MHPPADHLDLANASSDVAVLHGPVRCTRPFVRQALAADPHTPPAAPLEPASARHSSRNDNRLLLLLAEHPGADRTVLRAVLDATAERLAEGERPYAAALAPAGRTGLDVSEVRILGGLPGASARLRSGLRRRLAARA